MRGGGQAGREKMQPGHGGEQPGHEEGRPVQGGGQVDPRIYHMWELNRAQKVRGTHLTVAPPTSSF